MAHCPEINNAEVRNSFNDIVQMFNGAPLSIEEFKSVDLRNQRTGNNEVAINIAYSVWNKTMGENIPKTIAEVEQILLNNNKQIQYNKQGEVLDYTVDGELFNSKLFDNKNKTDVFSVLNNIINNESANSPMAFRLLELIEDNELGEDLEVVIDDNIKTPGLYISYVSGDDRISINPQKLPDMNKSEEITLHEVIHYISVKFLKSNNEFAKKWKNFYNKVKIQFTTEELLEYGFTDEHEFLAELMSNKEFMQLLSEKKPVGDKKYKNLWEDIWSFLMNTLGIVRKDNLYTEAFALGTNILEDAAVKRDDLSYIDTEEGDTEIRNVQVPIYNNKLLDYVNELKDGKARLHSDTKANVEMLRNKVQQINKLQYKSIAKVKYSSTKVGNKLGRMISIVTLSESDAILNKYNLLKIQNDFKTEPIALPSTNANKKKLESVIKQFNEKEVDWRLSMTTPTTMHELKIEPNVKKIDDFSMIIKNGYTPINNIILSNEHKNTKEWKEMLNQFGLETAMNLYKLNGKPLSLQEIQEYQDKFDNAQPNSNYDSAYEINVDEVLEEDAAEDFELAREDVGNIHDWIDDNIQDTNPKELDVNLKKITRKEKNEINEVVSDFVSKMKSRIQLINDRLDKTDDISKKRKIILERDELNRILYETDADHQNLKVVLGVLENDINIINQKIKNDDMRLNELKYYDDLLKLWDTMIKDWQTNTSDTYASYLRNNFPFQKSIIVYKGIIHKLQDSIAIKSKRQYKDASNKIMNSQVFMKDLERIKETSGFTKQLLDLSRTGEKLTTSIFKFLNNAENAKTRAFQAFNNDMEKWIERLTSEKYDISSKSFQEQFLEHDEDGDLTQNFISDYTFEFYKKLNKIEQLHDKLKYTKLDKVRNIISNQIRELEQENLNYVDINSLIGEDKLLKASKLKALKTELLKTHDEEFVDNHIKDIKDKYEDFLEYSLLQKERSIDIVRYNKDFERSRVQHEGETEADVETRLEIEADTVYKKWYNANNPYDYHKKLADKRSKLTGSGYKYLAFIPTADNFNSKFNKLKKNDTLYEFYKFYKENMDKYINYLPTNQTEKLYANFLPYVSKTTLQKIQDGENAIKTFANSALTSATVATSATTKVLNALGEEVYKIPVRYMGMSTVEIDNLIDLLENLPVDQLSKEHEVKIEQLKRFKKERSNNFSTDIIKGIKNFAIMAENYKYYNEVESTVLTGKSILKDINQVIFSKETKQRGVTNNVNKVQDGAKKLMEMVDYNIRASLYDEKKGHASINKNITRFSDKDTQKQYNDLRKQIKILEQDFKLNKIKKFKYNLDRRSLENQIAELQGGRTFTSDSVTDAVVQVTGMVNLGYNIKAAVNNYVFGKVSLMTHAVGEEDFTQAELKQAFKLLNKTMVLGFDKKNPMMNKIQKLSEKYNVVFEVNEAAYGVKSSFEIKTQKMDPLKPYWMTRRGEYYLQNAGMIATLLHETIKVKNDKGEIITTNLFEAYDNDGNLKKDLTYYNDSTEQYEENLPGFESDISALDSNMFTKLSDKIQQLNKMIHGNYDPRSPILLKSKEWGRAISQYKTWLPEGIALRFEKEHWDDMLGRNRKGRYRTVWEIGLKNSFGMFLKSFFNKSNINKDNFESSTDYANMLKNLVELRWLVGLTIAELALYMVIKSMSGDDDKEEKQGLSSLLNQLTRLEGDLSFYMSPGAILSTLENPAPAVGFVVNFMEWIFRAKNLLPEPIGRDNYTIGKWSKGGMRSFPIFNEINKWTREMNELNLDR